MEISLYCPQNSIFLQPKIVVTEGKRFELLVGFPTPAFQASALDQYANPHFIRHHSTLKIPNFNIPQIGRPSILWYRITLD